MNNALYNIKNGEYNCFCEEHPHNEQCECCDQQCCPCEPSESTEQVQSDWSQTDSTQPDYIKHKPIIPTKTSDLTNDSGFITDISGKQDVIEDLDDIRSGAQAGATAYQKPQTGIPSTDMSSAVQASLDKADSALQAETDPTVPEWAKAQNKPTYTAQEVGALPDSTTIPSALSDLTDDSTHRVVTDTEKTTWNNKSDFSGSYNDLSDKPTIPDAQIQSDWNQSDNTKKDFIKNKPTIPDVTTKADKVSGATNGNFAALDSNGNLIDSGHKHSDYLTQHQDLSNYVQKSQTAGLLKNDGTVDTTQYLSQHQDISGKEDITPIEAVASGTTTITAQVNKYYEVAGTVSSLTVTLPTPTANTEVTMVVVHLTVGANPTVIVTSVNEVVKFSAAYSVVVNKEYELSCLYNGSKWIVSSMEVAA